MKQTKKGFTLVELLVVIAILAILATVTVVGYTSFIQNAHESNDRTLVAQLNTLITRVDGQKYGTFHEVVEVLQENGIDVTKLKATATDHEILWDMDAQEFFYTADQVRNGLNIWIVGEELHTSYSTYYIGSQSEIETTLGFDAGTSSANVTVAADQYSVVIRTNGGNLTVESGNVTHYGQARYLSVNEAKATYTEKGTVIANIDDIEKITGTEDKTAGTLTEEDGTVWTVVETAKQLSQALEAKASKIVLGATIEINDTMADGTVDLFTVVSGSDVEINLNGNNIIAHRQVETGFSKNNSLIKVQNGAKLTLSGYGIISVELNRMQGYVSCAVISIEGTVIINDGVVVEHLGGAPWSWAIDVLSGTTDAYLEVNGGMVTSASYLAVRGFCNSTTNCVYITINGGYVYSHNSYAIWMQNPNSKDNNGRVEVTGGIVESVNRNPIYFGSSVNITGTITGGQILKAGQDITAQYK